MNWAEHYAALVEQTNHEDKSDPNKTSQNGGTPPDRTKQVEIADIGCGYGGLIFALSPKLPDKLILGLATDHRSSCTTKDTLTLCRSSAS